MDITLYFMKLEDKYWGVFLAALALLFVLESAADGKKRLRTAACYGILAYLIFLCPLTYRLLTEEILQEELYYELSHIWLVIVLVPLAFAAAWEALSQKGGRRKEKLYLAVGGFLILFFAGEAAYTGLSQRPDVYGIYDSEQVQVYDMILQDAQTTGCQDDITLWGPFWLMAKSRVYDTAFLPVYGKDIAQDESGYSDIAKTLYHGYTSYEDEESLVINKDQQLWALALFMNLYDEAACRYVVVIDPASQGSDVDARPIFAECKFEMVGQAGNLQVYRYDGKDAK